jgi:lysophospholipase L1-like esterase
MFRYDPIFCSRFDFAKWIVVLSVCSLLASRSSAQWVTNQSAPEKITADAAVDLMNTVLVFDRLFTRPRTATSKDYVKRTSDPSSTFYRDYLDYKEGRISRSELADRLPHVAMVGDSLSTNFYISSPASMLWRARTERQKDWFLDTDPSPKSIKSLYERLDEVTPVVATEYSTAGALVAPPHATEPLVRRLARTQNLRRQITRLTQTKRFPDVVLLWIGHNNTEWVNQLTAAEQENPVTGLRRIAREFGASYAEELNRLLDRAGTERHRVAVVVFGLGDFRTFFEMRKKAAALHAQDPTRYPYYDKTCQYFAALQPANQTNTIQLGLMMNEELRKMVAALRQNGQVRPNVRLEYSDAIWKVDLKDLRGFNRADAWHLSPFGHDALAHTAFKAITPGLAFVGINEKSGSSNRKSELDRALRIQTRQRN